MIYHYRFFNHGFEFQDPLCNSYFDWTMLSVNISNNALVTVKNADYCCIIHDISKSEVTNLLRNYVLEGRGYI